MQTERLGDQSNASIKSILGRQLIGFKLIFVFLFHSLFSIYFPWREEVNEINQFVYALIIHVSLMPIIESAIKFSSSNDIAWLFEERRIRIEIVTIALITLNNEKNDWVQGVSREFRSDNVLITISMTFDLRWCNDNSEFAMQPLTKLLHVCQPHTSHMLTGIWSAIMALISIAPRKGFAFISSANVCGTWKPFHFIRCFNSLGWIVASTKEWNENIWRLIEPAEQRLWKDLRNVCHSNERLQIKILNE